MKSNQNLVAFFCIYNFNKFFRGIICNFIIQPFKCIPIIFILQSYRNCFKFINMISYFTSERNILYEIFYIYALKQKL